MDKDYSFLKKKKSQNQFIPIAVINVGYLVALCIYSVGCLRPAGVDG